MKDSNINFDLNGQPPGGQQLVQELSGIRRRGSSNTTNEVPLLVSRRARIKSILDVFPPGACHIMGGDVDHKFAVLQAAYA